MVVETGFTRTTSPVKMVGLMRPSTIMEEVGDESANSDISSQMSFRTATKGFQSDVSSTYDTALESTVTSTQTDASKKPCKEEEINVDDILELAIERSREMTVASSLLPQIVFSETIKITQTTQRASDTGSDVKETSIDLIDLEKTFGQFHNSPHSSMLGETAVDVVVIDDDEEQLIESENAEDDDDDDEEESIIDILSDEEEIKHDHCGFDVKQNDNLTNAITSKYDSYDFDDGTFDENKENVTQDSLSGERSMKFNDTMEEVEYMLKKGMEYMAARDMQSVQPPAAKCIESTNVPPKQTLPLVPPAKSIYSPKPQSKHTIELKTSKSHSKSPICNLRMHAPGTGSIRKGNFVYCDISPHSFL